METAVYDQLRSLVTSLVAGGGVGLLYDLFLARRFAGTGKRLLTASLFILLTVPWLFITGLFAEGGPRLSYLCGAVAGMCLYYALAHDVCSNGLFKTRHFIHDLRKKTAMRL